MTDSEINLDDIRRLTGALAEAAPADRLEILKSEVMANGGRWDLPSALGDYRPALVSVQVHGVYAMAEDVDELAGNWCRAARNILCAAGETMPPARVA